MATKNKDLEKQTKAQLIERLQAEMHKVGLLEHDKERIKEEYNAVAAKRAKELELVLLLQEERNQLNSVNARLRDDLRDKDRLFSMRVSELRDMTTDRDNWKKHFLEEQAANRKSKELLVRQAHLAGELAQMVTPSNLRNN